jgi:hypothetical protein
MKRLAAFLGVMLLLSRSAAAEQELFGELEISFTEGDAVIVAGTKTRYEGAAKIVIYRDTETAALEGGGDMTVTETMRGICKGTSTSVEKWTISGSADGSDLSFSPFYEVKIKGTARAKCRGQGWIQGAFETEQPWGVLDVHLASRDGANTYEERLGNGPQRMRFKFEAVCPPAPLSIAPSIVMEPNPASRWPRVYSKSMTTQDLGQMHACGSILNCDPAVPAGGSRVHGLTIYPVEATQVDPTSKTVPTRIGPAQLCYSVSVIKMKFDPLRIYTPLEHTGADPKQHTCAERVLLSHEDKHAAVWDTEGVAYLERWRREISADRKLPTEQRPWRVATRAEGDQRLKDLIEAARAKHFDAFAQAAETVRAAIDDPTAIAEMVRLCPSRCWQPNPEECE